MRKIKELNEWRDSPCPWIGRLCNAMLVIPNLIYRFNATPIKIPENYFMDMDKLLLKSLHGETKGTKYSMQN